METRPLTTPAKGMLIFNDKAGLAATITRLTEGGFQFEVHNGAWAGIYKDGSIHIPDSGDIIPSVGIFEQIVRLNLDDVDKWYLRGVRGVAALLRGEPLAQEARLSQVIEEKGLEGADLADQMEAFLKSRGLTADFAAFLLQQPDPERKEDDYDDEPAF